MAFEDCSKLVIFRVGSMGDTIVALPCFHAVRRAFPKAKITLLTNISQSTKAAPLIQVLGDGGFVDEVVEYPSGLRQPMEIYRLVSRLRQTGADRLIYMMPVRDEGALMRDKWFFRLAGFRHIHAMPDSADLRVSRVDEATGRIEPEAARMARCFAEFGPIDLADPANWDMKLSAAERAEGEAEAAKAPSPFIAVNMGGKVAPKDWGYARWAQLITALRAQVGDAGLAVVGAPDDAERADRLIGEWGPGGVNACGKLSPRGSAALLAKARLFIGHDSGPLHLAACVGTPSLGLFGDYNKPAQWHPFGAKVDVIHEMRGVEAIEVDLVLHRALALWNAS